MELKHRVARHLSEHHPRLWADFNIRFRKHHFETEYWLIPLFCGPDKTALDVGMNMGNFAFYMAKFSRAVVGFEPNIDLWPHLRKFLGDRVRLESAALSDRTGPAEFRYIDDNTGVATVEARNALTMIARPDRIKTRLVALRTLDSFALTGIAFIKLDVEGHEEAVLRGAEATLATSRPSVLVESEDRHNPGAPARLASWFSARGYDGFFVKSRRLWPVGALRPADCDPRNLDVPGGVYINNFIYIPRDDPGLIARAAGAVAKLQDQPARGIRVDRMMADLVSSTPSVSRIASRQRSSSAVLSA
jgi:FkbM family methyltransferase